ncbi:hypothetical protein BMB171_C4625 [Bacillus thuringiensis BMB171]|nr:hypothetical protein BMB171_C4625 [Bacillus thuringiensis BMB171]
MIFHFHFCSSNNQKVKQINCFTFSFKIIYYELTMFFAHL